MHLRPFARIRHGVFICDRIKHCQEVAKRLEEIAKVEQQPRMEGRRMTMLMSRK